MSQLARDLLEDPKAREQLRDYLANKRSTDRQVKIRVHAANGRILEVTPKVVPKAA